MTEKILESYHDVFSDIINVLLFQGRRVIKAEDLEEQAPRAYYKAEGKLREIERDVVKRWKKGKLRIACFGIENQTKGGPRTMCEVLDRIENKGRAEGRAEGEMKRARETVINLHNMGMTNDFIARAVNVSVELVKEWLSMAVCCWGEETFEAGEK